MARKRPPMQPLVLDSTAGVIHFQENVLVRHLLNVATQRGFGMNYLATVPCPRSDREQFVQLIGYSLSGFSELSYVRDETCKKADAKAEQLRKLRPKKS